MYRAERPASREPRVGRGGKGMTGEERQWREGEGGEDRSLSAFIQNFGKV